MARRDRTGAAGGTTWVGLLRGVNVGGKNRLPMAELVAMVAGAGGGDVRTYIQSGNVVFRAETALAAAVPKAVGEAIFRKFGFRTPVVIRSLDAMRRVLAGNPFATSGAEPDRLHVAFLADKPDRRLVAGLDPRRSPGDSFVVRGREVYLHLPNGVARTKISTGWLDASLGTVSTMRNWRTAGALVEMMAARG